MKIFSDERLLPLGIISGTVSKHTGSGRDKENVKKLCERLGINAKSLIGLNQVHGDAIIKITDEEDLKNYHAKKEHRADGWLLAKRGAGVMILTADCVPVFVWDSEGRAIGLSHCGWRGVVAKLPAKTAQAVKDFTGKDKKLCAFIGPHINNCCFEVKDDVASQFDASSIIRREGKIFVDLTNEIILQLTAAGLDRADIKSNCGCTCTCCNSEDFFSFRRDKSRDSLISFAYLVG